MGRPHWQTAHLFYPPKQPPALYSVTESSRALLRKYGRVLPCLGSRAMNFTRDVILAAHEAFLPTFCGS